MTTSSSSFIRTPLADADNLGERHRRGRPYNNMTASAHQTPGVRSFLKNCFGQQIIGYTGSVDLTRLNVFPWHYIRDQVYGISHTSLLNLCHLITDTCNSVTSFVLRNVHAELLSRKQMSKRNDEIFEDTRH
ncbi:hypothetical protein TNCV_714261 [Trichonephila clavipes]|nr:hypothetical protein TNCV_714261 [Trichonephila clavipes]